MNNHSNGYITNLLIRIRTDGRIIRIFFVISVLALTLILTATALAQLNALKSGDRIKVSAPKMSQQTIIGTVMEVTSTAVILESGRSTLKIPRISIESLAVSKGRKSNTGKGALIGATAGGVFLGFVTLAGNEPCNPEEICWFEFTDGEALAIGAITGAVTGAAAGAIIGLLTKTERWEKKPLEMNIGMLPSPYEDRAVRPSFTVRISLN